MAGINLTFNFQGSIADTVDIADRGAAKFLHNSRHVQFHFSVVMT